MAFVCYEDFTDVQRIDVDLKNTDTKLAQVFKITPEETYDGTDYYEERLGTLRFTTESLPIPDRVATGQSYGSGFTPDGGEKYLPLDFASYHNSILKIKCGADGHGGGYYNLSDNTLYFVYGGGIAGDHPAGSNHPYNSADVTYDEGSSNWTSAEEDKKIAKILKKVNRNKPQFGLGQVPNYGKSRSGREYGGFIKESVYNKMKYKPTNKGKNITKKGPYEI